MGRTAGGPGLDQPPGAGYVRCFLGAFCIKRSVWERAGNDGALRKSPVLDSLLRRPARSMDVKVGVDDRYPGRPGRQGFRIYARSERALRQPIRQLLPARAVLPCRRIGHGCRPDVLRSLSVAFFVLGDFRLDVGGVRRHVAPGDRRRACDRDRPGVEFHPEPASDVQQCAGWISAAAVFHLCALERAGNCTQFFGAAVFRRGLSFLIGTGWQQPWWGLWRRQGSASPSHWLSACRGADGHLGAHRAGAGVRVAMAIVDIDPGKSPSAPHTFFVRTAACPTPHPGPLPVGEGDESTAQLQNRMVASRGKTHLSPPEHEGGGQRSLARGVCARRYWLVLQPPTLCKRRRHSAVNA